MNRLKKLTIPILTFVFVCGTAVGVIMALGDDAALADMMRMSSEERVQRAQSKYDSLKAGPDQDVEIILSFRSLMKSEEVKAFLDGYPVSIGSVFQAVKCKNNTFSGTCVDCEGKSFDQIVKAYREEYIATLTSNLESGQEEIRNLSDMLGTKEESDDPLAQEKEAEDKKAAQALESYVSDLQLALVKVQSEGIVIYGLKLKGPKSVFSTMTENRAVRAIEILNDRIRDLTPIQPN